MLEVHPQRGAMYKLLQSVEVIGNNISISACVQNGFVNASSTLIFGLQCNIEIFQHLFLIEII
jgi:hypothetical protein